MFDETWRATLYVTLLVVWLASFAVRYIPALRSRYPDAQKPATIISFVALAGIFLLVFWQR